MQIEGVCYIASPSQLVILLRHYSEAGLLVRLPSQCHAVEHVSRSLGSQIPCLITMDSQHFETRDMLGVVCRRQSSLSAAIFHVRQPI